jgi:hypothetical protein
MKGSTQSGWAEVFPRLGPPQGDPFVARPAAVRLEDT